MTPAERLLWQELRANRTGLHFRRSQVNGNFIADFYCEKARLVVEVDGLSHALRARQDRDRDAMLAKSGVAALRIPNGNVIKDPGAVAQFVAAQALERMQQKERPIPQPLPAREGE